MNNDIQNEIDSLNKEIESSEKYNNLMKEKFALELKNGLGNEIKENSLKPFKVKKPNLFKRIKNFFKITWKKEYQKPMI